MPFGMTADVRRAAKENIEGLECDDDLILAPIHVLEPEMSVANLQAFVDAAGNSASFRGPSRSVRFAGDRRAWTGT